ncbi:MAG: ABC transporter permease [Candidatus Hydrogenedentales bacterium]
MRQLLIKCPESLDQHSGAQLYETVNASWHDAVDQLSLDLSSTREMDSIGSAWLLKIADFARDHEARMDWQGETQAVADFMGIISPTLQASPPLPKKKKSPWESLSDGLVAVGSEFLEFVELSIDALYWTLIAPFEGKGFRFNAFVDEIHEMGVRAVKIVCLMNFLMGLIIAMLSAKQVEAFGLQIYVATLIVIGFARELAAVVTAIVVSARTGAAIAAELATMTVQEEIDALRGMGLNVAQYLVTPKLLALIVVLPCLSVLGLISGILGGAVWGIFVLEFRPSIWYAQTLESTYMDDLFQGMLKTFFFAIAIVMIGCHNGLRVKGGSRGVGLMTTRAVVMDIFSLICIDIIFATIFYYVLN